MHDDASLWIEKAEGDYEGAIYLSKKRSKRIAHLICFSYQQSAEKYLEAYLVEKDIRFSKTHFMKRELLPLCEKVDNEFKVLVPYLEAVDPYSVEFRYPGDGISKTMYRLR